MTARLRITNKSLQGFYFSLFDALTLPCIAPHGNVAVMSHIYKQLPFILCLV